MNTDFRRCFYFLIFPLCFAVSLSKKIFTQSLFSASTAKLFRRRFRSLRHLERIFFPVFRSENLNRNHSVVAYSVESFFDFLLIGKIPSPG